MVSIYGLVFWVGVIYTVITFILGGLTGIFEFDGDFDTHLDGHVDGGDVSPTFTVFPLKPITIVSFLTVFGGIGLIGSKNGYNAILVFITAIIAGLFISFLLYKFLMVPLYKAQNTSSVYQKQLIGMSATVISTVIKDGFGTISYVVNGSVNNSPAQHVNKELIPQGQEVMIYKIQDNIFYVQPLNYDVNNKN